MSYTFKSSGSKQRPEREKAVPQPTRSRSSSSASSASFASAVEGHDEKAGDAEVAEKPRFSVEEEAQMLKASHDLKDAANKQFSVKDYSSAISTYDKALAELPAYLDYELAVLQSNIAACYLQLREWKEAVNAAEKGLDNLERELPLPKPKQDKSKSKKDPKQAEQPNGNKIHNDNDENKVVELPDDDDEEATAAALKKLNLSDQRKADILRIRTKLLLRRARAKVMLSERSTQSGQNTTSNLNPPDSDSDPFENPTTKKNKKPAGVLENGSQWGNLSTALADYQLLSTPEYFRTLPAQDQKTVIEMLRTLPPRVEEAKKREVDEMMGKLKDLGNGLLKPFGLSTDMFKMKQDPATGGWSMNFDQGGRKS